MDETFYNQLPLQDKVTFIQKQGNFIEAVDYYSFRILLYVIENHHVELLYDEEDHIVSVEFVENRNELPPELEANLSDSLEP